MLLSFQLGARPQVTPVTLGVCRIRPQTLGGSWKRVCVLRVPSALDLEAALPRPVFNLDPNSCLDANVWGEPVPQPGKPSDTDILPSSLTSSR